MPSALPTELCQHRDKDPADPRSMGALRVWRGAILGDFAAAPKMAGLAYRGRRVAVRRDIHPLLDILVWTNPPNNKQTVGNRLCHRHRLL
ncbi:hypothetical protein UPYG_G00266940 [Umbra pygmaea]|uniref:Uncharacterized protein n=1 Tax=Umbra pygmaea TaxID=75934 RepID=A0ABD0WBM0_UMBPY